MNSIRSTIMAGVVAALAGAAFLPAVSNAASQSVMAAAAEGGRALSAKEIYRLYKGKSWIWKDSIAYFRIARREFTGWSHAPGPNANYADGRWFLPGNGKLCFRATWVAVSGAAPALTCFEHREAANGATYIRKAPDGEWWAFKDAPPNPWDEVHKVKPGNLAAKGYSRNKAYVDGERAKNDPCLSQGRSKLLCHLFGS